MPEMQVREKAGPPVTLVHDAQAAPGPAPRGTGSQSERDEFFFELSEIRATLLRRKLWIAAVTLLCLAAAVAFIAGRQPAYTNTVQLMFDPRGLNVSDKEIVPQPPSSDVNDSIMETQVRLLTSDDVLQAVVTACNLENDPDYAPRPSLLARLKASLGLGSAPDPAQAAGVSLAQLRRQLTVQREGKSFVVTVTTRASRPAQASRIASAVVSAFLTAFEKHRQAIVGQARTAMAATLQGQRDRVVKAENEVEAYKASAGILDVDGRVLNTTRLTDLNTQVLSARNAVATLQARFQQLEALRRSPAVSKSGAQVIDTPLLTQLRTNRAEIARQQANLRAVLGPMHPQVQEVDAQLRSLDQAIDQEFNRLYISARSDYQAAVAREKTLSDNLKTMEGGTATANGGLVRLRELEREAEAQRSVYEKSLERERQLNEQQAANPLNASVVAEPSPVSDPVGLKPSLLLAAALLFGLLLGGVSAVAYERLSGRIYSAGRLAARGNLSVLGVLPMALPASEAQTSMACALVKGRGTATSRALFRATDAVDHAIGGAAAGLLVLGISSGRTGAVVASNIVLAESSLGRRTLLVECQTGPDGSLLAKTKAAGQPGSTVSCAVEGFPAFEVAQLDQSLVDPRSRVWCGHFDRIVFDLSADSDEITVRGLADAASAILLVVEAGVSTYAELDEELERLSRFGRKIVGALIVTRGQDVVRPVAMRTLVALSPA